MSLTPGQQAILNALREAGVAITRESYIAAVWNDEPPDPWGAEDEAELPEFLQIKLEDGE